MGGDFNIQTSDFDLLAITVNDVSSELLEKLKSTHTDFIKHNSAWDNRVEVAYMSRHAMKTFKEKPSRIVRISPGEPLHTVEASIHWLMDWYMVQNQGEIIFGPNPSELIPNITQKEFIHEVKVHMGFWREWVEGAKTEGYQAYIVLLMCRNMYAVKYGRQTSKDKGAAWVLKEFPEWAQFIETVVKWRRVKSQEVNQEGHAKTKEFVEFALNQVDSSNTK